MALGPLTEPQLHTSSHKPDPSCDWKEAAKVEARRMYFITPLGHLIDNSPVMYFYSYTQRLKVANFIHDTFNEFFPRMSNNPGYCHVYILQTLLYNCNTDLYGQL